jgi:hypothetical protein
MFEKRKTGITHNDTLRRGNSLASTRGEAAGVNTVSEMTGKVAGKTAEKVKEKLTNGDN